MRPSSSELSCACSLSNIMEGGSKNWLLQFSIQFWTALLPSYAGWCNVLKNIENFLCELGDHSGVDLDTVKRCLEKAIEQAVCEYFGVQDCEVDLNQQTVGLDLYGGVSGSLYRHFKGGTQKIQANGVMEVKLSLLPPSVISKCEELFRAFMDGAKTDMLERRWRERVHSAVEGVIIEKGHDCVKVNLGDEALGIMTRAEWTPTEVGVYRQGRLLQFYVLKVRRIGNEVLVYLSRGSINFPAALVRKLAPWVKVKAARRIRGKKTWLQSDTLLTRSTVLAVQKELRGEVIEVKARLINEAIHFHHQEHQPDRSYAARPFFWPEEIS